jgi:hypothetical protein
MVWTEAVSGLGMKFGRPYLSTTVRGRTLGLGCKFSSIYLSSGKPRPLADVVQVAMGEAAIKFLLLGICFFFLR